ncbi:NAD(P)/FAD-dependent oxidoreductase [Paenibacillus dakarensis]|uniref:NAD(P)/FAD-dependent oxidoreductase n=1 Tax=Paenibacillus dakarensis TaxID=1527293 RepID=UPI0006D54E0A|nr:NAD(P)/FAD-dependent oxidoreductase [Paenibacillus dakarensis]
MNDCIIVGGGIAGLQAAIQLGRYSAYDILVIDKGEGRSTLCRNYPNILGFPEGISGPELRSRGRKQAEAVGVHFVEDTIEQAQHQEDSFVLTGKSGREYQGRTILLATGLTDRYPDIPGLVPTLGRSVYVCPDCDGYEVQNRQTVVLGAGNAGANMAILLSERTEDITYINHEKSQVDESLRSQLKEKGIVYAEKAVKEVLCKQDGIIQGVLLEDGEKIEAERGFIAFGGNKVHSELAVQLGAELEHNHHVKADPRSKMTNVPNVWVAGDLGVHSELTTVAMGDGVTAAVWIHKALKSMNENK